jgi:hypothetical protein
MLPARDCEHAGGEVGPERVESEVGKGRRDPPGAAADVDDASPGPDEFGEGREHRAVPRLGGEVVPPQVGDGVGDLVVGVARGGQEIGFGHVRNGRSPHPRKAARAPSCIRQAFACIMDT